MAEAGEKALLELEAMLATVDLSATSVTKFDVVKGWIAERAGLPMRKVACFWVSKPGNFDVRFGQPSVVRDKPTLGLALVPALGKREAYLRPAERLVASGLFEAMIVYGQTERGWSIQGFFVRPDVRFDTTLGGLVLEGTLVVVEAAPVQRSEPPYGNDQFEAETGLGSAIAIEWLARLKRKGQIVIQGPPGTGKTWVAERLGRLLVGDGRGFVDTVQFHPAYGYEDFVSGLAPVVTSDGSLSYEIRPGRFIDFCDLAREASGDPCVLVIDEFNRADLARVFGELMYLLEYRERRIRLANGPDDGRFAVPANVFIIATMNTADRSIALIDHALRRRFSFVRLAPDYGILRRRLERDGIDSEPLISILTGLNTDIADPDFEIGISFFMGGGKNLPDLMSAIWQGEIEPYIREIMHGRPEAAGRWSWQPVRERLRSWFPSRDPVDGSS
ncbi:AAA family ATPase [Lichenihabitans sp. Uapishka_5]|uniref:McrB family protein n=1 Tax=Lichenihabitans sp. Uapishka_5 TaxID=3037302 RepID=UPI0029E7D160|nr:AAA family ATPase [Lichenihabitans sp. Uapishka_5]MDX7952874.1 AAA family ATPase [Lichenihabitans sp. Uapishka_5]